MQEIETRDITFALLFAACYYIILFAPFGVYIKNYFDDKGAEKKMVVEQVMMAFGVQLFTLGVFSIAGTALKYVSVSGMASKPSHALQIFFGEAGDLPIWEYWLRKTAETASTVGTATSFEDAQAGVAMGGIVLFAVLIYFICLMIPFALLFGVAFSVLKEDKNKQQSGSSSSLFSKAMQMLFYTFLTVLMFWMHSRIAFTFPDLFLDIDKALAYNFFETTQFAFRDLLNLKPDTSVSYTPSGINTITVQ